MPGEPLRLPIELQAALQWATGVLDSRAPRTDYRMGGGSILALARVMRLALRRELIGGELDQLRAMRQALAPRR